MSDDTFAARIALDRAALAVTEHLAGPEAVVWENTAYGRRRDATPLTGIATAMFMRKDVSRRLNDQVARARGAGHSWEDIGRALDLVDVARRNAEPLAYAAFVFVTSDGHPHCEAHRPHAAHLTYRCGDCGQWISDHGPYGGHPTEEETGHDSTCARLVAAVTAWRRLSDED